jgi:formylglycine-generating enzyme required for sulfatase activity
MPNRPSNPSSTPRKVADPAPDTRPPDQPTLPPAASPPADTPASLLLQPGARPVPDYELVRQLGKGGFGEVWQARGPGGLDFALKFIQLNARGSALELRSLEIMKSIRHPNLVGMLGIWQRDNVLILAMELCDGSLQDRLNAVLAQKRPGIPIKELLNYMRDAAKGLDALHAKNVQHRDVKPLNLLLMQNGVKVADFGLAKVLDQPAASHTGALSVHYAAPEFFKGQTTPQSDQYSLAATYYHLRIGRPLFEGGYHQVAFSHVERPPDLSPLPEEERKVLVRALAKEPDQRWPSCEAFVNALIKAYNTIPFAKVDDRPQQEAKPTKPKPAPAKQKPASIAKLSPAGRKKRSWFWPLVVSGLLFLPFVTIDYFFDGPLRRLGTNLIPSAARSIPVVDLGGGVKMDFVLIPKGKFKMGSPKEEKDHKADEVLHEVEITRPFYLAKYPVTQEQYAALMGKNPSYYSSAGGGMETVKSLDTKLFPVEQVSWSDAQAFCKKMQETDKQKRPFRLPTEAEWEYACRAGTTTSFSFGSVLNGQQANCDGQVPYGTTEKGPYLMRTTKVGSYGENPWGLCDLHGNVWQWCQDYYGPYEDLKVKDPLRSVRNAEERFVLRGGSWYSEAKSCRAASRDRFVLDFHDRKVGFRVAFSQD